MVYVEILRGISIRGTHYEALVLKTKRRELFVIHKTDYARGRSLGPAHSKKEFPSRQDMMLRFPCAEEREGWIATNEQLGYCVSQEDYIKAKERVRERSAREKQLIEDQLD